MRTLERRLLWGQMGQRRRGNGYRGGGGPVVPWGEGQRWPRPLQLFGSYPGAIRWLLRDTDVRTEVQREMRIPDSPLCRGD